ncbi:hypothetical protein Vretimale_15105 [Volvox reticuliferus]|uniref:Uncharacterized protein n=1 Tax=Volvox reticuliferus TaxID=1737510 RepID=A0A8J4C7K4_9CHLO|nr:hypothetical protein Vretifemale_5302 [Volvox reticuliferus]GIM11617.1 hypothetical protein Vretimale_15105 [Volvox reticuliferus]
MSTAISPQPSPTHLPASQSSLKPCQRSCRGLMLYFPPLPQHGARGNQSNSWRSSEPICLGLSAARNGPNMDLQKLHEAREIPAGQHVDFSVVLGHAVFQTYNGDMKALPPGCMSGLELMRFCKTPSFVSAATASATLSGSATISTGTTAPTTPIAVSIIKAITGSLKTFASSFRILTSSADTNERLNRTWSRIVEFDPQGYADKFEAQMYKNLDSMTKWLRDLQDAVSKPKA